MERTISRVKTVVEKFRRLSRPYREEQARLFAEKMSEQNLVLGMVVFLVWQRDPTLETLATRVLEWMDDFGRVAGLPPRLLKADDLESRIPEAILAYADVVWRVESGENPRKILPLIEYAIKARPPSGERHAISCYFMHGEEASASVERDWIARRAARPVECGGYPRNPDHAHMRGFMFQGLQKSGTIFTTHTLSSSLNIPAVDAIYRNPLNNIMHGDLAPYQTCAERLGGVDNFPGFERLAPEIVAQASEGGVLPVGHASAHPENLDVIREQGIEKVVIQMRDPRAAALSWVYYNKKIGATKGAEARISALRTAFLRFAIWNNSWLTARGAGDIDIHVVRHEDLAEDAPAFMSSIYDFLGLALKDYPLVFPEKTAATHFRSGRTDEWKEVLDAETQAAMAAVMRDIPCGY